LSTQTIGDRRHKTSLNISPFSEIAIAHGGSKILDYTDIGNPIVDYTRKDHKYAQKTITRRHHHVIFTFIFISQLYISKQFQPASGTKYHPTNPNQYLTTRVRTDNQ